VAPGLQTHGQRVAHRNSTHSYALDNTFRFIDGMTNLGVIASVGMTNLGVIASVGIGLWWSELQIPPLRYASMG
jgi:hypothetical protein